MPSVTWLLNWILYLIPQHHLNWQTPYFTWFQKPYDFKNKPLLPFGRVMSHNPFDTQTKLSPNGTLLYWPCSIYHSCVTFTCCWYWLSTTSQVSNPPSSPTTILKPTNTIPDHELKKLAALPGCYEDPKTNIDYVSQTYPTSSISDHDHDIPRSISPPLAPHFVILFLILEPSYTRYYQHLHQSKKMYQLEEINPDLVIYPIGLLLLLKLILINGCQWYLINQ